MTVCEMNTTKFTKNVVSQTSSISIVLEKALMTLLVEKHSFFYFRLIVDDVDARQ